MTLPKYGGPDEGPQGSRLHVLGHVGGLRGGGSSNPAFNEAYAINCPCGGTEGAAP